LLKYYVLAEMPGVARVDHRTKCVSLVAISLTTFRNPQLLGRLEVSPAIDSRPDRIIPGTHWIGGSNDKNGMYPKQAKKYTLGTDPKENTKKQT
jgi:hypothetical protein